EVGPAGQQQLADPFTLVASLGTGQDMVAGGHLSSRCGCRRRTCRRGRHGPEARDGGGQTTDGDSGARGLGASEGAVLVRRLVPPRAGDQRRLRSVRAKTLLVSTGSRTAAGWGPAAFQAARHCSTGGEDSAPPASDTMLPSAAVVSSGACVSFHTPDRPRSAL